MKTHLAKTCSQCGESKSEDDFYRCAGRLQAECKACNRARGRKTYADRDKTPEFKDAVRKIGQQSYERNRALVEAAKSVPCQDCGGTFPLCVMDLDHREGETKVKNVSALVWTANVERVAAEIAKCDVVCSNCHRVRTFTRAGWRGAVRTDV